MKKIIVLLFALFLFVDCGTKTKTKSETETEIKAKEVAEVENQKQREIKRLDSIRVVLEETLRKEFLQKSNESSIEEGTKRTTTETTETLKNPTEGFRPIGNGDLFINDSNGRIIERKTKTIIEEKFKKEQQKEIETKKIEEEKRVKDSISTTIYIDSKIESTVEKHLLQYEKKNKAREDETVKEGWQPGFWFYAWIFIILVLIALFIYLYRKFGTPMGWFGLLFGAFKGRRKS